MITTNSYYFLNLGCPKNQADGNYIRGALNSLGLAESETPDEVDFIIVNTCAFIERARRETLGEIGELLPYRKNGTRLVAVGCYPVLYDIKSDIAGVDAAFGLGQIEQLLKFVAGGKSACYNPRAANRVVEDVPYAYVKISDGCDNHCTYCTIPLIRGPYRSRLPDDILNEVEYLIHNNVKEIVLVAQDTSVYGADLDANVDLVGLCKMISGIDGVEWIRVMYTHPAHLSERMIDGLFGLDKVCRYLDIPVQHISKKILGLMGRKCGPEKIRQVIKHLRNVDNDISLRTTLMVGFPGESDDDFRELLDFVEETEFDYLGVFRYSPEQNTKARGFDEQVDRELADDRYEMLYDIADRISDDKARLQIGRKEKLLIDGPSLENADFFEARSYRQAAGIDGFYKIPLKPDMRPGEFVNGIIKDVDLAELKPAALHK